MPLIIKDDFAETIEAMVASGVPYVDAVTSWCERHGLEPEAGAELVQRQPLMMARMQMEAEGLKLVKREDE